MSDCCTLHFRLPDRTIHVRVCTPEPSEAEDVMVDAEQVVVDDEDLQDG